MVLKHEDRIPLCELNAFFTMPKRVGSKSYKPTKKSRLNVSEVPAKRTSFPRNCKNINTPKTSKSIFGLDLDYFSYTSSRMLMGACQVKDSEKIKNNKKDLQEEEASMSSEDIDIVFDVQEDKKNKVYEVITVASDDETPNQISYERIYAEDSEKKVVKPEEIESFLNAGSLLSKPSNMNSDKVQKTAEEKAESTKESKEIIVDEVKDSSTNLNTSVKIDSDDDVVCVAVIDAKTKAEQKKAKIEEICLSSDSDSDLEITRSVSPLKLKLPTYYLYNNRPNYFENNAFNNPYCPTNTSSSDFSFGFNREPIYPYVYGNKSMLTPKSNKQSQMFPTNSDWESSSSPKATFSSSSSLTASESPKVISGDESSTSSLSIVPPQLNLVSGSSGNESSSSASSSGDEEKTVYWKAGREFKRKTLLRYEEFTKYGKQVQKGEEVVTGNTLEFKVMSYNVLSQNLLEQHRYLYKNHDRRALGWERRWALIYSEIKYENPEILCLQEVSQGHLVSHYAKLHDLGYRWVYKKRTGKYEDGVAVFYKAALFEDEEHSLVEFYQPGVSVLDRDNVGIVIRLKLKNSPQDAIVIAATHLLYNPRRSDVKLAQVQLLLAEINRLAYNKDTMRHYPVIVTGDFNLKPSNGVYKFIVEGSLAYEGLSRRTLRFAESSNNMPRTLLPRRLGITDYCLHLDVLEARQRGEVAKSTKLYHSADNKDPSNHGNESNEDESSKDSRFESGTLIHSFVFESVYPHVLEDGQKEATTHHDKWVTVDYIFYSKEDQENDVSSLYLLSRLRLPTQDECGQYLRHLPNFAFGSDHLPLVAKFLLALR